MFLSYDLNVPDNGLRRVIKKCPRLLISSVEDQLKPALLYVQRLGFKDLDALAYQDPILLVSSVEHTLIPKLRFLECIGFLRSEAIGMILRCPALFTFSIENNFKPKLDYFMSGIKGKLENLKEFPQYFAFSLEKRIKPRHLESMERGLELQLSLMLKSTDEEFEQLLLHTKTSSVGNCKCWGMSLFIDCVHRILTLVHASLPVQNLFNSSLVERSSLPNFSLLERLLLPPSSISERTISPIFSSMENVFKRSALMAEEVALSKKFPVITFDCNRLVYLVYALYFVYLSTLV